MRYTLSEIPNGIAGTDATLRAIAKGVLYDLKRPQIRLLATRLVQSSGANSKDQLAEARAIYQAVSESVRYQKDPVDIETVQSPEATLKIRAGDCDDHSGLVAALAMALGIPARFRVVGDSPDRMLHIFPELFVNGKWHPADTTEPRRGFGWRAPKFPTERVYNIKGEVSDMSLQGTATLTRGEVKSSVYKEVGAVLRGNWQNGLINRQDVEGYLRVIAEGNFPSKSPVLVEPTEKAIRDFLDYVDTNRIGSVKPPGESGLEGLDGFLSSIWSGVKKAVSKVGGAVLSIVPGGGVVKKVVGAAGSLFRGQPAPPPPPRTEYETVAQWKARTGQEPLVRLSPTVQLPEQMITTQLSPRAASAFGQGLFSGGSTLPLLIGGGILAVVLLTRKGG